MQLLYHVCCAAMVPPAELSAWLSAANAETSMRRYNNRYAVIIPRLLPSRNLPLHPGNFYVPPNLLSDIVFCISLI